MATLGNFLPGGTDFESLGSQNQVMWPIGQALSSGLLSSMTLDIGAEINTGPLTATAILMSGPDSGATAPNSVIATSQRTDLSGRSQYVFTAGGESIISGTWYWLGLMSPTLSFENLKVYLDAVLTAAASRYSGITYPTPNTNPSTSTGNVRLLSGGITYSTGGGGSKLLLQMANY